MPNHIKRKKANEQSKKNTHYSSKNSSQIKLRYINKRKNTQKKVIHKNKRLQYFDKFYNNSELPDSINTFANIFEKQLKLEKEINKFFSLSDSFLRPIVLESGTITEVDLFNE